MSMAKENFALSSMLKLCNPEIIQAFDPESLICAQ